MTFQMQSHHHGVWTPMEDGPAKSIWKPRKTAYEAVHKCIAWTGLIAIPAMRVIDLSTGEVVWADTSQYPEAGPKVQPEWAQSVYAQVRREYQQRAEVIGRAVDEYKPERAPEPADDGALFSLAEVGS